MTGERFNGQAARQQRRRRMEQLVALAEHLDEPDRLLVEHVYQHGLPLSRLARVTRSNPRTLQRRLTILLKRMSNTEFQFMARSSHRMDDPTRRVARRVVLRGQSYRTAAATMGLSLHEVRRRMARFRRLVHQQISQPHPTASLPASPRQQGEWGFSKNNEITPSPAACSTPSPPDGARPCLKR